MQEARIAELLKPFVSTNGRSPNTIEIALISTYIDLLIRWNRRINLTAIRDPEGIVTRHFGESLFAASHLFPAQAVGEMRKPVTLADVGTGPGFPGVPIKIWNPEIRLTLIESNQRKATFLRELVRTLTLTDVDIQSDRAETLPPAWFDIVTLRAVERFDSVLPVTAGLTTPTGRLALLIGSSQVVQAHNLLPTFLFDTPLPIPNSNSRCLLVGRRAHD